MVERYRVGESVLMCSPHTGDKIPVQYRGRIGDNACVVVDGYQRMVPHSWIEQATERREAVALKPKRYPTATQVCDECGGSSISYLAPAWFMLDDRELIEQSGEPTAYHCGDCDQMVSLTWDMGLGPDKPDPDERWEDKQVQGLTSGRK